MSIFEIIVNRQYIGILGMKYALFSSSKPNFQEDAIMGIKTGFKGMGLLLGLGVSASALAVPTLQLGIPNGSGGYVANQTIGSDEDTAFTTATPFTLAIAGVQSKDNVVQLGGQYTSTSPKPLTGEDWSDFSRPIAFNGKGAILVASVPNGTLLDGFAGTSGFTTSLLVGGIAPFYADEADSQIKEIGGNHFPAKDAVSDFFFFDISNLFSLSWSLKADPPANKNDIVVDASTLLTNVPNFQDPGETKAKGDIKNFSVSGLNSYDWVHFDVIALESALDISSGRAKTVVVAVDDQNNPFSKDVTWYKDGTVPPNEEIPEPASLGLLGLGLVALGAIRRRKAA